VAGFATPTGFAGHAGAKANAKLTFDPDHSVGADQLFEFGAPTASLYNLIAQSNNSKAVVIVKTEELARGELVVVGSAKP
jgi:hypothetical protein